MKALYIADFSNWVYKFKYTFQGLGLTLDSGEFINTSVLFGWNRAIKSNCFNDIVVCLDGYPIRSNEILPQYKQQREHAKTDQLFVSKKEVVQFLTHLGEVHNKRVRVVASYGQEADQVIASVAHIAMGKVDPDSRRFADTVQHVNPLHKDPFLKSSVEGSIDFVLDEDYDTVIIGTTDSDMYQLKQLGTVFMDSSWNGSKVDYSEGTPKAVHNMPAQCIAIYKAFLGDTSDNVPATVPTRRGSMVRKMIVEHLNTEADFLQFCTAVRLGLPVKNELLPLKQMLQDMNSVADLRRNYTITKLGFESTPRQVVYPDYSIREAALKYNISGIL